MGFFRGPNIITDQLVLAMDAASPKSYPGSGTTWTDRSGNGYDGELFNSPTFTSNFRGGITCLETDEFIALDDKVPTDYVSVECWYTRDSAGSGEDIVFNKESCWEINDNGGNISWAVMANNKSLSMLPGGFYELCNSKFNYNCHFGIEKTGYIYYALKYGYTIKMCYTFGESSTYSAWTPSKSLSNILAKYNVPFLIFWNKLIPGLFHLPNANTSLITVIGKDIQCKQINNPTRYDVSLIQSVCLASIIDLYYTSINNEVMDIDNKSHLEFTIYE